MGRGRPRQNPAPLPRSFQQRITFLGKRRPLAWGALRAGPNAAIAIGANPKCQVGGVLDVGGSRRTRDQIRATVRSSTASALYAKQRNDHEVAAWMSEIRLRAMTRIGELLGSWRRLKISKVISTRFFVEAATSISTANRYEQLATNRKSNWRQPARPTGF
jgi:hypothetical protein